MPGEWTQQLPDDLKTNEAFTGFATLGDFAKAHLDTQGKLTEFDGKVKEYEGKVTDLSKRLESSIPKLPENASDEDRNTFYQALGRPEKWEDYQLDGENTNAKEWQDYWRQTFFGIGVPADMATKLTAAYNAQIQKLVETHNANIQKEIETSSATLKAEWGDKYDENVELAKRLWTKHTDGDFDKAFNGETSANRFAMLKYITKMAQLTGEDGSPPGAQGTKLGIGQRLFPNSPPSPTGK